MRAYQRNSCLELLCLFLIFFPFTVLGFVSVAPLQSTLVRPNALKLLKTTSEASTNEQPGRLSDKIVQSLDLAPVVRTISNHAATRRGREAILSLICQEDMAARGLETAEAVSSRQRRVTHLNRDRSSQQAHLSTSPIAASVEQAQQEYALVKEATVALNGVNRATYPLLYGADSCPWDNETIADTDHDDWLVLPSKEWTLEHVLQADQVVQMLLRVSDWGNSSATRTPMLSGIVQRISRDELQEAHHELNSAVDIVRKRSLLDPRGRSSFQFRLSEDRFPVLRLLRETESELEEAIEKELSSVLRNVKGSPEIAEYQGRMMLCVPKGEVKTDVGVVRGEAGGFCYVEPHQLIKAGEELASVQNELSTITEEIEQGLKQTISQASSAIDAGIHALARLDVAFAKAAYGSIINGAIPEVCHSGRVDVKDFVHPVLTLRENAVTDSTMAKSVVPIDLLLSHEQGASALIISGPNGGGKTLALKSFGLVCLMAKLAIPIPQSAGESSGQRPRVDFYDNVLVEMGDQQSVIEGESTLMAKLNSFSAMIKTVAGEEEQSLEPDETLTEPSSFLVLMDELGGGTDPAAGGAIAQAVLEKLLESEKCHVVATTHSPRLKALSYDSDDFHCATVLLKDYGSSDYKLPSYQLQYGLIGDSYALGAASRCHPPLPEEVLSRAANLMNTESDSQDAENVSYLRSFTASLEQQVQATTRERNSLEISKKEIAEIRSATIRMAGAYSNQLARMEERLQSMLRKLREDETKNAFEVVGETLETLRLVAKRVKSEEELLKEHGLKKMPADHEFMKGESVVILADGEWEGTTGTVVRSSLDEIVVSPSGSLVAMGSTDNASLQLTVKKSQVAVWDYDSAWEDYEDEEEKPVSSVRETRQRLNSLLSTLETPQKRTERAEHKVEKGNSFKSARQRKAARSKRRKK